MSWQICPSHSFFASNSNFLSERDLRRLTEAASSIPVVDFAERQPAVDLAFSQLQIDGKPVSGRLETAAGSPIYLEGGAGDGPAVEGWMAELLELCNSALEELTGEPAGLSSLYVDCYPPGGCFVPHTDRDFYGEYIFCVSVGSGSCALQFDKPGHDPLEHLVTPGSAYVFGGDLRWRPWTHRVDGVTSERFALTLRSPR